MVVTLPCEVKRLTQEIGGGIVETGGMPSYKDFTKPQYGHLVQKCLKAGVHKRRNLYREANPCHLSVF
jgi:4-hydroxybutyryl-CoA dehydratase/vinylacetyl-CoA-Delta-isomerase